MSSFRTRVYVVLVLLATAAFLYGQLRLASVQEEASRAAKLSTVLPGKEAGTPPVTLRPPVTPAATPRATGRPTAPPPPATKVKAAPAIARNETVMSVSTLRCPLCGSRLKDGAEVLNCCFGGGKGAWAGTCGNRGKEHTWQEGFAACNDHPQIVHRAEDIEKHGDPSGHFGMGMKRVCPWASNEETHKTTTPGIGVYYLVYDEDYSTASSNRVAKNIDFFAGRALEAAYFMGDEAKVHILAPESAARRKRRLLRRGETVPVGGEDAVFDAALTRLRRRCDALGGACVTVEYLAGATHRTLKLAEVLFGSTGALYEKSIIVTSRVRGPFLPKWWVGGSWAAALVSCMNEADWLLATQVELTSSNQKKTKQKSAQPTTRTLHLSLDRAVVVLDAALLRQFEVRNLASLEAEAIAMTLKAHRSLRTLQQPLEGVDWDVLNSAARRGVALSTLARAVSLEKLPGGEKIPAPGDHLLARMFASPDAPEFAREVETYTKWIDQAPLDWHTSGQAASERLAQRGILLIFAYYEKDAEAKENLQFFLDHGLDELLLHDENIHVTVVVNGPSTLRLPYFDESADGADDNSKERRKSSSSRFRVIERPKNTCFDFGSWGIALWDATARGLSVSTYVTINASVKGPFMPRYALNTMRWIDGFTSLLRGDVVLGGLAINCPDGVGNKWPHVMSMAMVFNNRALAIAEEHGIFACAETYAAAVTFEGRFSNLVLKEGYNIDSMQWAYVGVDWRKKTALVATLQLTKNVDAFPQCPSIALDIFYRDRWYYGMTAHPYEFMLYKTNRHVNMKAVAELGLSSERTRRSKSLRSGRPPRVLLASHNWDGDGAPRYLCNLAEAMHRENYDLLAFSLERDGVARDVYEGLGARIVPVPTDEEREKLGLAWGHLTMDKLLKYVGEPVDLVVLNTAMWANAVMTNPRMLGHSPRVMWIIHEIEIVEPRYEDQWWFGMQFEGVRAGARCATAAGADAIVFVAETQRALWSECDTGNFHTLHGRPGKTELAQDENAAGVDFFFDLAPSVRKLLRQSSKGRSEVGDKYSTPRWHQDQIECYATRHADVRAAFCSREKARASNNFRRGTTEQAWACDWERVLEHRTKRAVLESRTWGCSSANGQGRESNMTRSNTVQSRDSPAVAEKSLVSRASLNISKSAFVMTMVGTVCERKRQLWGVLALKSMLSHGFDAWLIIVGSPSKQGGNGDPAYVNLLDAHVERSKLAGRVKFVPFGSAVVDYLQLADLHLSPSLLEAYPLNTLEAMSLGVPVVATAAGGTAEQFVPPEVQWMLVHNLSHPYPFVKTIFSAYSLRGSRLRELGELQRASVGEPSHARFEVRSIAVARAALRGLSGRSLSSGLKQPSVSFVVRTYPGQLGGASSLYSLRALLRSLLELEVRDWEALVVQSDRQPMPGVYQLLVELDDDRIRFIAPQRAPEKSSGGYEVTDGAIEMARSKWLVVTNGDNTYEPRFLNHLNQRADVVAYDFYSRYVHYLDAVYYGSSCSRYFTHAHATCKSNLLMPWHTDLGANVVNLYRWNCEGRRYSSLEGGANQEQDGKVAWSLRYWGWRTAHVGSDADSDGCLFNHNPNINSCVKEGGPDMVWLDRSNKCVNRTALPKDLLNRLYSSSHLPRGSEHLQGRCLGL